MSEPPVFDLEPWRQWLWVGIAVAAGVVAGLVVWYVAFAIAKRLASATRGALDDTVIAGLRSPAMLIFPAFAVQLALTSVPPDTPALAFVRHLPALLLIAGAAWLVLAFIAEGSRRIVAQYQRGGRSPFEQRSLETRIHVLTRIVKVLAVIIAGAIMMMTLPEVRQLGASILASAGIAGVVAGLAAQSVLGNLIAGVQMALTEPIRIGDNVLIEDEFGTIEEIGSTFVVVRIWDLRRLIVPLNYFLQNRFQNWTLNSSDMLGTAIIYLDYRAPIEPLRAELRRILESSPDWDQHVSVVQVTDTTERAIQVRALMSAKDPGTMWNLRCEVREKLLAFVQQNYPDALPRLRAEPSPESGGATAVLDVPPAPAS